MHFFSHLKSADFETFCDWSTSSWRNNLDTPWCNNLVCNNLDDVITLWCGVKIVTPQGHILFTAFGKLMFEYIFWYEVNQWFLNDIAQKFWKILGFQNMINSHDVQLVNSPLRTPCPLPSRIPPRFIFWNQFPSCRVPCSSYFFLAPASLLPSHSAVPSSRSSPHPPSLPPFPNLPGPRSLVPFRAPDMAARGGVWAERSEVRGGSDGTLWSRGASVTWPLLTSSLWVAPLVAVARVRSPPASSASRADVVGWYDAECSSQTIRLTDRERSCSVWSLEWRTPTVLDIWISAGCWLLTPDGLATVWQLCRRCLGELFAAWGEILLANCSGSLTNRAVYLVTWGEWGELYHFLLWYLYSCFVWLEEELLRYQFNHLSTSYQQCFLRFLDRLALWVKCIHLTSTLYTPH